MNIIKHCLEGFAKIAIQQDCNCDLTHDIPCSVHDDQRFSEMALKAYEKMKDGEREMNDLLQRLWDAFSKQSQAIKDAIDDTPYDEILYSVLTAIGDTSEMKALRLGLFNAGVKRVAGFRY